ncbi:hypothetical protein FRC18_001112 [Serendipita sp. 400]|nr:hypothetical protein FRC18_001112 [Serendipita sp. 400]
MRALARGDVEALIKNCTLLSVQNFLEEMMSSIPKPSTTSNPPVVADDLFEGVPYNQGSSHILEKEMYKPLQDGFNTIAKELSTKLKGKQIHCLQTYTKTNPAAAEQGFDVRIAPDLYLTFHEEEIDKLFAKKDDKKMSLNSWKESLFQYPGLLIEVKRSASANFPWKVADKTTYDTALTADAKDLLEQIHRYVAYAQYPAFPYRFIYCITVTGQYMRFWKWSATGARVSDSIKYTEHSKPVVDFLRALHLGGDHAIGVNVDKGLLFEPYDHQGIPDKDFEGRVAKMVKEYNDKVQPAWKDWSAAAQRSDMWKLGSLSGLKDEYLVLQYPIYATIGIFGRGTRCYLAIKQKDFKDGKLDFRAFRTFKASWQFIDRSREDVFYAAANDNGAVANLASIIGGSALPGSQQSAALFVDQFGGDPTKLPLSTPPTGTTTPHDDSHFYQRELRWLLIQQVGRHLTTAESSGEIVQCLRQCLAGALLISSGLRRVLKNTQAHKLMRNKGVLHRDISVNNVLIDILSKEGFLVDLDSAKYIGGTLNGEIAKKLKEEDEKRKSARTTVTGTIVFSAIALVHSPAPLSWHDYESFFWLLLWCTIRHVNNVTLVWANGELLLNSPENRQKALDQIFRYEAARVDEAKEQGAKAKLEFLENCEVSCANEQLETLINELRVMFNEHYALLRSIQVAKETIIRSYKRVKKVIPDTLAWSPFSIAIPEDIPKEVIEIEAMAKSILITGSYAAKEVGAAVKRAKTAAESTPPFPTYQLVMELFNAFDTSKASTLETTKFTPIQKGDDYVFKLMY